nr:immunoglobulin light chain junction region [Macaca mulatta]MOX43557.1 immunoglobulin light chain junction region [Macaca mulatta]MOX46641.1 immunoglobulin light chain junction region [Macaca mulatta]MOX47330.1 immunoglobulin light chain junction region [Macaca mulatta]
DYYCQSADTSDNHVLF